MAEYCYNSCSKCPPFACTHARWRPRNLSLACQWSSGQCHAKHAANAGSVHQCCAPATDRLAVGRCPIYCSRPSWGQYCSVAIDPVEWKHESRRCLLVKSYSVACPARRGAVLLEDEELARHVAHYGQQLLLWQEHVAVVVAVDLYRINGSLTDQRWSTEICEAELWDSNWNHNRLTERCSGADETFSSNLLLLHCCRNVQTVILRIVQGCHCEHLVGEPHEVQESIHVTFSFVFSSIFAQIRTSNFRKVVWQHWRYYRKYYMGFVRNLVLFSVVK